MGRMTSHSYEMENNVPKHQADIGYIGLWIDDHLRYIYIYIIYYTYTYIYTYIHIYIYIYDLL